MPFSVRYLVRSSAIFLVSVVTSVRSPFVGRGVDLADQIVDLPLNRADEDLGVEKPRGPDELFGNLFAACSRS